MFVSDVLLWFIINWSWLYQTRQFRFYFRLEAIAVKMEMSIPVLSDAEYEMQKDLKKIENNVSQKQTRINQVGVNVNRSISFER